MMKMKNKITGEKMSKISQENRVRRSVYPTNRVKHGIRQDLFLYEILRCEEYIKLSMNKYDK